MKTEIKRKEFKDFSITKNLGGYCEESSGGYIIGFTYKGMGVNFLNINIDIEKKVEVEYRELNSAYHRIEETDYKVTILENDFIFSAKEIFSDLNGFDSIKYEFSQEEIRKIIEITSEKVLDNIEDYVEE